MRWNGTFILCTWAMIIFKTVQFMIDYDDLMIRFCGVADALIVFTLLIIQKKINVDGFKYCQLFSKLLIVFISNCKGQWPCLMSWVIKALRISLLGSCFIILALRVTERVVTKNTYIDEIIRNKDSHFKTLWKAVKQVWIDWMIRVRIWSFTL